nr:MAG TPA: hypothetical protein [Caudoviricetes sp.]DAL68955.1 MAG TPA: hypothetical protein [Caudoviricetes sp.]DAO77639.1 MAG TPA: hypothetical protein [Caudoviricetes sp.]
MSILIEFNSTMSAKAVLLISAKGRLKYVCPLFHE